MDNTGLHLGATEDTYNAMCPNMAGSAGPGSRIEKNANSHPNNHREDKKKKTETPPNKSQMGKVTGLTYVLHPLHRPKSKHQATSTVNEGQGGEGLHPIHGS